ncbi:hypothetical protein ACWEU6_17575 [Streptosporangium sandarakinum]|uniref:hypothetical protein n=1 Tax=Streptosporangium sandarakinum TaxID=1260955 RepID=UPI0036C780AE
MTPPLPLSPVSAVSPTRGMMLLLGTGTAALAALKIYAGVTAPEIPPERLREIARIFNRLADDIDGGNDSGGKGPGGKGSGGGIAGRADALAEAVWNNPRNGGEAVEAFQTLYQGVVRGYAPQLARDCRVVAAGCEAYAQLVETTRKNLADIEDLLLQILWLVMFQPMTTAIYGFAAARIAALIKVAQGMKSAFALSAGRIMAMTFPKYAMTTLLYMILDGAAYGSVSLGITRSVQASHGLPTGSAGENATEYGRIAAANGAYALVYDGVKATALRGVAPTRATELIARLSGSGLGYTPAYNLMSDDGGEVLTTPEQWAAKLTGHGLRAAIFPPGWKFR